MTGNMEEDWKEKMWASARGRFDEAYQRASSVDTEALFKLYILVPGSAVLQHVMTLLHNIRDLLDNARRNIEFRGNAMDMINHAKRKYDFKGSPKNIKLGQLITRLRMGRLGYLLLLLTALSTLAVPMMFQSILPQQVDQEFERAMTALDRSDRSGLFKRKIKLPGEKTLRVYEVEKDTSEISESKSETIAEALEEEADKQDNLPEEDNTIGDLASDEVKLPDPVQSQSKFGQLERELSEIQHFPSMKESDLSTSEQRSDDQQMATPLKPPKSKRFEFKNLPITEETVEHADERRGVDKVKEDSSHPDPRTVDLITEQVSLDVTPPRANLTVDSIGSPNGFTEAYEEVLKLSTEANKTGENSAQSQEESVVTELLPTDQPADLSKQVVEVTDVKDQKLSIEKNDPPVREDKLANVGLASEELVRNMSVGESNDVAQEATSITQTDAKLSEVEHTATDIPERDSHVANVDSQTDTKETVSSDGFGSVPASTGSNASVTVAEVKADVHQDVVGTSDESVTTTSGETVVGSDSEAVEVKNTGEGDKSPETSGDLDGGLSANNNSTPVKVGEIVTSASDTKKTDDGVVKEQSVQAEVQKENQPEEIELIPSLKSRAASGSLHVGLLNMGAPDLKYWQFLAVKDLMTIPLKKVEESLQWNHIYPEWIDEEQKYGAPKCPSLPMPMVSPEVRLDVVIAYAPCTPSALQDSWKNVSSLQVLLGAATLAVTTGKESVLVLIFSECRPLVNLFKCGELREHQDQGWLYEVNVEELRKRISLPIGSCQLSVSLNDTDKTLDTNSQNHAYVTILHSGYDYVCGAIATAHSIRKTGSTKDLVVLVDKSIYSEHRQALQEAGWKVRELEKIHKSSTVEGKQQLKDFSRFRLWQLTDYSKVIYIEADVLVLRNIDHLFRLPEISGSGSTRTLFSSGLMVIEPSSSTFQFMLDEMEKYHSQVGGDWEFLNRLFPWWHRIPRYMNYLKYFWTRENNEGENMNKLFSADPPQLYAIHYWGYKPWQCFRDYDCNWNTDQKFASDEAHAQWFKVYDDMPENLQKQCGLSTATKAYLEHNRRKAEAAAFPDKHYAINITDPRLNVCQENHCDWNGLLLHWQKNKDSPIS